MNRTMADNKELAGKVAIVTGAGRNIGRAIALTLAQAGASVVVNVRANQAEADSVVREIEAAGGKAASVLGDIADRKDRGCARRSRAQALRPHRHPGEQRRAAPREADRRDELRRMARGHGRHPRWHVPLRACLPAGDEEKRRQHHQYRRHERAYRLEGPRACHDGKVRAGRLLARTGARSGGRQDHRQLRGAGRHRHDAAGAPRRIRRIISPTAPSPASAASRRMWRPWCAFCAVPAGATSPARPSTSAAAPISARSGVPRQGGRLRAKVLIHAHDCSG